MASDVGIDGLNITDAVSGATVPVAGDFVDDGTGIPKWFQALVLAWGALDGGRAIVDDVDGQRLPTSDPQVLGALLGTLANRDVTPPVKAIDGGSLAMVAGDSHMVIPATDGHVMMRVQFFADTPGDPNTYVTLSFGGKAPGLRLYDTGDPGEVWTDESLTVACVGGPGTVTFQPMIPPPGS